MNEHELEIIIVLSLHEGYATVQLPDTSLEEWTLDTLPPNIQAGDRVGIQVEDGNWTMCLLPPLPGLQA